MPDRLSEIIRAQLQEARGTRFDINDPDIGTKINRSIREARGLPGPDLDTDPDPGQPAPTPDPRTIRGRLLATAASEIRSAEPTAGVDSEREWGSWAWSRRVAGLLDQNGRLPGERGYNPATTGPASQSFHLGQAIDARRQRWLALGRI
jgi:hypothetical protein